MKTLTARQETVARLICEECLTTKEIADRLNVTFKTAEVHRSNIYVRLGVYSTAQLCRWYWTRKFSSLGEEKKV